MDRWSLRVVCALAVSAVACAQDLQCYQGAVEINGVCECPRGTTYVRAFDACQDSASVLDDGGLLAVDASTSPVEVSDAAGLLDGRVRNDSGASVDATARDAKAPIDTGAIMEPPIEQPPIEEPPIEQPPPGSPCSTQLMLCGDTCINPRTDVKHCGSCSACKDGAFCQNGACVDVGCSDGTREAFADLAKFPSVAGCAATWPISTMLAERKLARCGNSAVGCEAPLDACSVGWHVCGNAEGGGTDVTSRIKQEDCQAQKGRFAMALGDQACTPCSLEGSGAACCGDDCVQQQGSCLWPTSTAWFGVRGGVIQLCGAIENPTVSAAIGVMCCRDGK